MRDVHSNKVPSVILNLFKKKTNKQLVSTPTIQDRRLQKFCYVNRYDLE